MFKNLNLQSSVITNAKKNPNFSTTVKYLDIELPEQVRHYFFFLFFSGNW